ncbi:Nucleoside-diphosphate-sugar epimerase [Asanoa hainanensis]|uniref:Nucleoside-diphosphate-sugar epimerase n=1 Tax=Asanoa hainanensis TaxID=560556 RepID=A0A239GZA9_9ACTN|nr:SDR family oxidoreductase [Asanoa hainanensis]SNS73364.1 Nucleoside-diphosphate-sugar epimerase [Asanoa hainanensis]
MRVFVTGASGWIGSAVVPELIAAGHQVTGLARSDGSAAALTAAGADVLRGDLDDLEVLGAAAAGSDAVIHLAFKHDIAFTGDFAGAAEADRRAVETFGAALAGSDRPFVIASGLLGLTPGRLATERDSHQATEPGGGPQGRHATADLTVALAERGVRSTVLRLPPTVHGDGDNGFMAGIVGIARATGVSGYLGDGANRWPAVHRLDAARLFRLALEHAPAGSVLHAVADEGVPIRAVADVIGRQLDLPVAPATPAHFGWLGQVIGLDSPASSSLTRDLLDWRPMQPGLLDDLEKGHYFQAG